MADINDVDRTPVAKDIWCYNPREKAFTWHVVVNHDAHGYVDRVQCKITGAIRKYKKQNTATKSAAPTTRKIVTRSSSAAKSEALEDTWYRGIRAWKDQVVGVYSPTKSYRVGDVFEHPTFGKGVVQARRENKVEVLFRSELKLLMSAR